MKLYTEEELLKYFLEHGTIDLDSFMLDMKPIELPSDEEIEKNGYHDKEHNDIFREGAKYVIDKIQGGNK